MLLTISTTYSPATDLGYLLHKHPARLQSFALNFGQAHVFYPEARAERCTAALLLDIDTVGLTRRPHGRSGDNFALAPYVSDRPYVASSFLSVAIAQVFGSALSGKSKERPQLVEIAMPLEAQLSILPCQGGEQLLRRLFEPLGYKMKMERYTLSAEFPEWGESRYFTVTLQNTCRLSELLTHLYVLIPVLDDEKHYWVDEAEIEKLLKHGENWLAAHPEHESIVRRYLKNLRPLTNQALAQLCDTDPQQTDEALQAEEETQAEARNVIQGTDLVYSQTKSNLNEVRLQTVTEILKQCGAKRVLDLGCGEGKLLRKLLHEKQFEDIVGMDVSHRALKIAHERLHYDRLPENQKKRLRLFQGSLNYRDKRLAGYDAAAVIEVIEHLDFPRLAAFERAVFEFARPRTVVLTTPNREYNVQFENLQGGHFRHKDHRFEWTRDEFQSWATRISERFGYTVVFHPVGPTTEDVGAPTQMAVFTQKGWEKHII